MSHLSRNEVFHQIDEQRVRQFESLWLKNQQPRLDDFLPEKSSALYAGTLEELIHVQLEFEWRNAASAESIEVHPADWLLQQFDSRSDLSGAVRIRLIVACAQLSVDAGRPISESEVLALFERYTDRDELKSKVRQVYLEIDDVLRPGFTLGQYELDQFAGQGGFGVVWRATDTRLGRRVAVKHLGQKLAKDAEFRRRFEREARVTARLQHPGIVPVYDVSTPDSRHSYYAMRLIEGKTLEQAITELHQLPEGTGEFRLRRSRVLQAFVDVCQTMEYAHSKGVLHRDLKPSNIIVGDYGETVILDWGLAGVVDATDDAQPRIVADAEVVSESVVVETLTGDLEGTPGYMPPEQAQDNAEKFQVTSDVYSLGATLYHVTTGQPPFDGADSVEALLRTIREADFPRPAERKPGLESSLGAVIEKAMSHRVDDRYQTVRQLRQDLERFLVDRPVSVLKEPIWENAARWIRSHPAKASAAFLSLFFGLVLIFAGWMVRTAWEQQEETGRRTIVRSVEGSREVALAMSSADRFEDAASLLTNSLQRIEGRSEFEDLANDVAQIHSRAQRLAEFERLASQAQAAAFSDQLHRSAVLCQEALRQVEAFDHPDWWANLPVQDLTAKQEHQLQWRVYRVICLLASMRLSETSQGAYSLQQLLVPKEVEDVEAKKVLRSAVSAAEMANRFRPARGMRLVRDVASRMAGDESPMDLTGLVPMNSVDAAMMGSILDNNVPESGVIRTAVSGLLSFQDPGEVANRWLDEGLRENPKWYWLPVFMGLNQVRRGQPEIAVRTFSHALGIRDDDWVGYHYRAFARLKASRQEGISAEIHREHLRSALHDVRRAIDCDFSQADIYWLKALILNEDGSQFEQVAAAFLNALELEPLASRFEAAHFRSAREQFLQRALGVYGDRDQSVADGPRTMELQAALALWAGNPERAMTDCRAALLVFPKDVRLQALADLLTDQNATSVAQASRLPINLNGAYEWHRSLAASRRTTERERAVEVAKSSLRLAVADWQRSLSHLRIAEALLEQSSQNAAKDSAIVRHIQRAFSLDPVIDLRLIREQANRHQRASVTAFCDEIEQQRSPFAQSDVVVEEPALLNGDFELSLLSGWTHSEGINEPGHLASEAWNNRGGSGSSARISARNAKTGQRSLVVEVDCPGNSDSVGWIQQLVPATAGQTYRVHCQVFSEPGVAVKLRIRGGRSEWSDVNSENGGFWQSVTEDLECEDGVLRIAIEVQGNGLILLDDVRVKRVDTSG